MPECNYQFQGMGFMCVRSHVCICVHAYTCSGVDPHYVHCKPQPSGHDLV